MTNESSESVTLDGADRRLLSLLQQDCWLSNQALADKAHLSPATCLRRVRRLIDLGVIERQVALLSPDVMARVTGAGLTAILEVTLDRQDAVALDAFEARVAPEPAVQQCYRVTAGPDFVVIVHVLDMPAYHAFVQRVLTAQVNVRNVRALFSVKRSKFAPALPV